MQTFTSGALSNLNLSVSTSVSKNQMASSCADGSIYHWDLTNNNVPISKFHAHDLEIWVCRFKYGSDSTVLLTGSDDSLLKLWDLRTHNTDPVSSIKNGHDSGITSISSTSEHYFLSGR